MFLVDICLFLNVIKTNKNLLIIKNQESNLSID